MEYLYSQTGKVLTPVLQNPEEEDRLVEQVDDKDVHDEGFEEETVEDITVPAFYEDVSFHNLPSPSSMTTGHQTSAPPSPPSQADMPPQPSTSRDGGGQHPASSSSSVHSRTDDTSQAALDSGSSQSSEPQVRHFNGFRHSV